MGSWISNIFTRKYQLRKALCRGFPPGLKKSVIKVVHAIPHKTFSGVLSYTSENKITYLSGINTITFPYRVYILEITSDEMHKLSDEEKMILHCIYSRSCDGYVREKHIKELLATDMPYWAIPYIVKVCDEYVVEILEVVYEVLQKQNTSKIKRFCVNNWKHFCRSYNRMVSYWNEFYRNDCYRFNDYVGRKLFIECFGARRTMNCSADIVVKFNRDSICMGDDVSSHAVDRELSSNMPLSALLVALSLYVPTMRDVVWAVLATNANKVLGFIITDEHGEAQIELCVNDAPVSKALISDTGHPAIYCRYYHQYSFTWRCGATEEIINKHSECSTLLEKVKRELKAR